MYRLGEGGLGELMKDRLHGITSGRVKDVTGLSGIRNHNFVLQ